MGGVFLRSAVRFGGYEVTVSILSAGGGEGSS